MFAVGWRSFLVSFLVLSVALSGCTGDSKKSSSPSPSPTPTGSNQTYQDPVADFFPSKTSPYTNESVTLDASKSFDPEGGALTYAWNFGDGSTGSGKVVEHTYAKPGVVRIVLNVTSDKTARSNEAPIALTIIDSAVLKRPVLIPDAEGDVPVAQADLVGGAVYDTGSTLVVAALFKSLPPVYELSSVIMLDFSLGPENTYEVYGTSGALKVYDFKLQQDVPNAQVTLDPPANSLVVKMPFASIEPRLPVRVHLETLLGEPGHLHGLQRLDRAPDEGDVTYPAAP